MKYPPKNIRRLGLVFLLSFCPFATLLAQATGELSGRIVNSVTSQPVKGVTVTVIGTDLHTVTDVDGTFYFGDMSPGLYSLDINSPEIMQREVRASVMQGVTNILTGVPVIYLGFSEASSMLGVIDESFLDDDTDGGGQEISSLVILSNDDYINNIGFRMSPFRFRLRNYGNTYSDKYINGIRFNDQYRGVFNYAAIGAMNDLTRNGDVINYMGPGSFTFGTIGGSENVNMHAGSYDRGTRATVSFTMSNYYLRAMINHSTGLLDNGWAFTVGAGMRYSDEGFIQGTFYRNLSYNFAMEKQWQGGKHSLSFTTFGSPVERGQQNSSVQEVYDLVNNNLYNSNWGFQDGKKRNARVIRAFDPTGIFSHRWNIDPNTTLTNGIAVHYNRYGQTALNWYRGADPRPDYYRYLPSWYSDNPEVADYYTQLWTSKYTGVTQINWDELYRSNQLSVQTGDGSSIYMVEERRSDLFEATFNSNLNHRLSDRATVTAGLEYRYARSMQFKTVDDLMDGLYITDTDKFSEQDFVGDTQAIQNDLNKPGRRAYEGDRFGYDYNIDIHAANLWFQHSFNIKSTELYYGSKITYTNFVRDGNMRNGRYPDNSYGRGENHSFVDYAFKGGFTAKITGRHIFSGNVAYYTRAPLPYDAYISPRITDNTVDLASERVFTADISYIFSLPSFSGRVSAYQTNFYDKVRRWSYYYDNERTFVNHVLTGMNSVSRGVEVGFKYRLTNNWSFDFAGTVSEHYYSSNPMGTISYENGKQADRQEKVYMKDYYVGGAPQFAGTFGVNYFYHYWFFSAYLNGVARNYVEIAPLRRQASNYAVTPGNAGSDPVNDVGMEAYRTLTAQEKFKDAYTVDLSIGKILYLKNRNSMNFNFSLNNILNKKDIRTGGYEQARFDLDATGKFPSKYYYMMGINCFLNVRYNF